MYAERNIPYIDPTNSLHPENHLNDPFEENFSKESKSCSQLSEKENHNRVSRPSKAIILNDTDFESEESFLIDQSTFSTLTHKLNLDSY